jgi:molybdopterin synthase catalytic subunit
MISVQTEDFDHGEQYKALRDSASSDGAIVTFTVLVRDFNADGSVSNIFIEHYPKMTHKSLQKIYQAAKQKWVLGQIHIIHRIGVLEASEHIVFVGVSAKHRHNAFSAAEYIMDYLKVSAPFWKQEGTADGMKWVTSKTSDSTAMKRWQKK